MAHKGKQSFVLYHDIRAPLTLLTDEERGKLFLAILDYSERSELPSFDGALQMAFSFIRTALDRDAAAWEDKREKRREAGSLGGKQTAAKRANADFAKQKQQNAANQAVPVPVPASVPVPKEIAAGAPPSAFDVFWKAYPKKKNKLDAQRAFKKVKEPLETLLAAVDRQKCSEAWRRDNGQFIPYPASWLNAGAWADEIEETRRAEDDEQVI